MALGFQSFSSPAERRIAAIRMQVDPNASLLPASPQSAEHPQLGSASSAAQSSYLGSAGRGVLWLYHSTGPLFDAARLSLKARFSGSPSEPRPTAQSAEQQAAQPPHSIRYLDTPLARVRYLIYESEKTQTGDSESKSSQASASPLTLVYVPDPPNVIESCLKMGFLENLARACPGLSVLIIELPGFGFSLPKSPSFRFTAAENVIVLNDCLNHFSSPTPHQFALCFPCVAGLIAIRIAHQRQADVKSVIFVQTGSWECEREWADTVNKGLLMHVPVLAQVANFATNRMISRHWLSKATAVEEAKQVLTATADEALQKGACYCLTSALQSNFYHGDNDMPPAALTIPTLVMWGKKDASHRKSDKKSVLKYFPQKERGPAAQVLEFDNIGHFPDLEQSQVFAEKVSAFFKENRLLS